MDEIEQVSLTPKAQFNVAVCGHRTLPVDHIPHLNEVVHNALENLEQEIRDISIHYANFYKPFTGSSAIQPVLLCNMAEGADLMAVRSALQLGYEITPILPCPREEYAKSFDDPDQRAEMLQLCTSARSCFELPCNPHNTSEGYADAASVMLGHADILIALWNGQYTRYIAGTSVLIRQARRANIPVLCINTDNPDDVSFIHGGKTMLDWRTKLREVVRRALLPMEGSDAELCSLRQGILPVVTVKKECRVSYEKMVENLMLNPLGFLRPKKKRSASTPKPKYPSPVDWDACRAVFSKASNGYAGHYRNEFFLRFFFPLIGTFFLLLALNIEAFGIDAALSNCTGLSQPAALQVSSSILFGLQILFLLGVILLVWKSRHSPNHTLYGVYRIFAENCRVLKYMWPVGFQYANKENINGLIPWYCRYLNRCYGVPHIRLSQIDMRHWLQWLREDFIESQLKYHTARIKRYAGLDRSIGKLSLCLFSLGLVATIVCTVFSCINAAGDEIISEWSITLWGVLDILFPTFASFWAGYSSNAGHPEYSSMSEQMVNSFSYLADEARRLENEPVITYSDLAEFCEKVHEKCADDLNEWNSDLQGRQLQYFLS